MGLFGFGKKKEEKSRACACSCGCSTREAETERGSCHQGENEGIQSIKVLGSGCKNCHTLFENTKKAVEALGLPVQVDYVTDMQKIVSYGATHMPALVINEKLASAGKVLKQEELTALLSKFGG